MHVPLVVCLLLTVVVCSAFDYHKYLDKKDDFLDPLDPIANLEAKERKAARAKEEVIVRETATPLGSAPPAESELIRVEDCPVQNCTENAGEEGEEREGKVDGGVYYRRYIHALMLRLERKLPRDLRDRTIALNTLLVLDQHDLSHLRKFLSTDQPAYQDVTEVLSSMTKRVSLGNTADMDQYDFDEIFGVSATLVLKVVASVACVILGTLGLSRIRITPRMIISLVVCLFLVSVPWDWMQLYKKAVARRSSEISMTPPEHCTPVTDRTWAAALKYWALTTWSFKDDPCTIYHEAFAVDPILDVSPLDAFTATSTKMVVNPLQYIGEAIAKFFNKIGQNLPPQYAFLVMLFIMVLVVLYLIMRMDYQIKLPFYGGLERAPRPAVEADTRPRWEALEGHRAPRREAVEGGRVVRRRVEDIKRDYPSLPPARPRSYPAYLPVVAAHGPSDVTDHADDVIRDNDDSASSGDERDVATTWRYQPVVTGTEDVTTIPNLADPSIKRKPQPRPHVPDSPPYPASLIIGTRAEVGLDSGDHTITYSEPRQISPGMSPSRGEGDSFDVISPEEDPDYELVDHTDFVRFSTEVGDANSNSYDDADIVPVTSFPPFVESQTSEDGDTSPLQVEEREAKM